MRVSLNGKEIPNEQITYRELGFGQAVDLPMRSYEIEMALPEFISVLEPHYEKLVQELKNDYEQVGDKDPECLFKLNYGPLWTVLGSYPQCLEEILKDYLFFEFLSGCFHERDPKRWLHAINTIDRVSIDGHLIVSGQAYEVKHRP
jgi:hypothetical protein